MAHRLLCMLAAALALGGAAPSASAQGGGAAPQNLDFEAGVVGQPPPGWDRGGSAQSAGYAVSLSPDDPQAGRLSARIAWARPQPPDDQTFGSLAQAVDAAPWRGKRVRFRAAVRSDALEPAWTGLWMRVDRPGGRPGFFDNMQDRPIRSETWSFYEIVGDVARDAERISFGLILAGSGEALIDSVSLEVVGEAGPDPDPTPAAAPPAPLRRPRTAPAAGDVPPRAIEGRGMANLVAFARLYGYVRWFHPSDEAAAADWDAIAMAGVERVEGARNAKELAEALQAVFQPVAPTLVVFPNDWVEATPRRAASGTLRVWSHQGFGNDSFIYRSERVTADAAVSPDPYLADLGGGVGAFMPLAVGWDGERTLPRAEGAPPRPQRPSGYVPSGFDRSTRLAAVVVTWNLFQHFYPYFDVARTDWRGALEPALARAAEDGDDLQFLDTLRRLVARSNDGHGGVAYASSPRGPLPLSWAWIEDALVVTEAGPEAGAAREGDVILQINGAPAERRVREREAVFSGSPQWKRHRAVADLLGGPPGDPVTLTLRRNGGRPFDVVVRYRPAGSPIVDDPRPAPIAELRPGIVYLDFSRVTSAMAAEQEALLVSAKGIVFDMRGYPRERLPLLARLADRTVRSALFEVPSYAGPDQKRVEFSEGPWVMDPIRPRLTDNVVLLIDESAISFAESIAGLFKNERLGVLVGSPTAGANGNIARAVVPGGYRIVWTGMRVRNHDGSPHHIVGVVPDVRASRTIAGVRAGRDEVLEEGLEVLARRLP